MSALGSSGELSREGAELAGKMCREVALTYFVECRCLAVVTEDSSRTVDYVYMHPFELPELRVVFLKSAQPAKHRSVPLQVSITATVHCIFNDTISSSDFIKYDGKGIINWKGC
jgi:hypothetical protein